MTRRRLQIWLGLLWLLDGALQLQPFMFGRGFADQVIRPAGEGQPGFVAAGVDLAARLIGAHPAAWDTLFAVVQLAIGLGLLIRAAARPALAVSIAWALGVWYFGEGLGGLASGHADMLTGAPGAVLLYAVLAAAAWPAPPAPHRRDDAPASWLPAAWAALWLGTALLRALPGQNTSTALADTLRGNADDGPAWLSHLDHGLASSLDGPGAITVGSLVLLEAAIGTAGLFAGAPRRLAAGAGILLSLTFWVIGQNLGGLYTGQATDPNSAPLVLLLALALLSVQPARRPGLSAKPAHPRSVAQE